MALLVAIAASSAIADETDSGPKLTVSELGACAGQRDPSSCVLDAIERHSQMLRYTAAVLQPTITPPVVHGEADDLEAGFAVLSELLNTDRADGDLGPGLKRLDALAAPARTFVYAMVCGLEVGDQRLGADPSYRSWQRSLKPSRKLVVALMDRWADNAQANLKELGAIAVCRGLSGDPQGANADIAKIPHVDVRTRLLLLTSTVQLDAAADLAEHARFQDVESSPSPGRYDVRTRGHCESSCAIDSRKCDRG